MILSAIILRFIVEPKGVKSNYFGEDLEILKKIEEVLGSYKRKFN